MDIQQAVFFYFLKNQAITQKSHICEEGGAHFRISVWHLLMNLKKNYQKNCWSGPIKNIKKNKEKHMKMSLFYTCVPKILMIWYTVLEIVWQTEIGNYGSCFALYHSHSPPFFKNLKDQNFEKMKKIAGDIIILHMCIKYHNHWVTVWYGKSETGRIFCHFVPLFALLPS